ncbi:MAG: radical SAM protein, partial [Pseudomonadota bacterium]
MPPLAPQDFPPAGRRFTGSDRRAPLRTALSKAGHYGPGQTAGRFYPIACVALEITQRCNLDCTLCYLSERAEAAHDIPLPVLFARLAQIESHYGPATSVQITGGDPTLRRPEDLEALCREIARLGMRS